MDDDNDDDDGDDGNDDDNDDDDNKNESGDLEFSGGRQQLVPQIFHGKAHKGQTGHAHHHHLELSPPSLNCHHHHLDHNSQIVINLFIFQDEMFQIIRSLVRFLALLPHQVRLQSDNILSSL